MEIAAAPSGMLITDIGLPELNGRQLADAGRTTRHDLRILFMTGYAENAASSSFLLAGMEIISKPFKMDVFAKRVREMLGGADGHAKTR